MSKLDKYYTKKRDKLNFLTSFNEPIEKGDLYKTTKILDLRQTKFNHPIKAEVIPYGVTHIYFGSSFMQELEPNIFPDSVIEIYFSSNVKINKDVLPNSLEKFNIRCISGEISVDLNVLPDNLLDLKISAGKISFENSFPKSLKRLSIYSWEKVNLPMIPKSLEYFMVPAIETKTILDFKTMTPNLKHLILPNILENLNNYIFPDGLEILNFLGCEDIFMKDGLIPETVHTVYLREYHKMILCSLPDTVETIIFSNIRNDILDIPIFIKQIKIKYKKHAKFFKKIPFGCQIITYGDNEIEEEWLS